MFGVSLVGCHVPAVRKEAYKTALLTDLTTARDLLSAAKEQAVKAMATKAGLDAAEAVAGNALKGGSRFNLVQ